LEKRKKKLSSLIKQIHAYKEYKRAYSKYVSETDELKERQNKYQEQLKDCPELVEDIDKKISVLKKKKLNLEHAKDSRDGLKSKLDRFQSKLPEDYSFEKSEAIIKRIGELEHLIKLKKLVGNKHCPLCKSKLDVKFIEESASNAEKELPKKKAALEYSEIYVELKKIKAELKSNDFDEDQYNSICKKLDKLELQKEQEQKIVNIRHKLKAVKQLLTKIKCPEEVEKPSVDKPLDKLEQYVEKLQILINLNNQLADVLAEEEREFGFSKTTKEVETNLKKLSKKKEQLSSKINKINSELPFLISDKKQYQIYTEQLIEVKEKLDHLEKELEDLPVIEALIKAYSSKGLKIKAMSRIGALVEQNLNKFSQLIFAEPINFKIQIKENEFSVLADRLNGRCSDVKTLSGAEGSSFILLLIMSILPLIPRRKRTDSIILDEMDAFLGPPLKELYFQKFIPMLSTIVPKVVVITTAKSCEIKNARYVRVIKEGKVSRLEESFDIKDYL